ncbi:hypothetical protein [Mucilaginibacter gotjawali]|uniref:Uncharacterized protein n=2 Tax=Mucilaginibacter gotjawali TaxID=1550579 RepID=A0A0X8X6M8_9SPHI|nr:hypothetical protein [Mucilaginibacter gotjawali]MBB3056978.1 hypothetical protein [Mucilaginibacter gotjawali]BAU56057.1 hypothetical protein MgSA37_04249 [Mucilaginibacter gotjawali]
MKLTCLTVIAFFLFSCDKKHPGEQSTSLLSNILSITDNEDKGIKEIVNFYGGSCEYSIGTTISTDSGTAKFFELKLSKSDVADKYANIPEFTASNLAYTFYKNLKNENRNYKEIHSVLILNGKEKYESKYTLDQLEQIATKMQVFNKAIELIKTKNYDGLKAILSNESYTNAAKDTLIANLKKIDLTFGNVKGFILFGARFETHDGFNVLNIIGAMLRDKKNNQVSITIDLKPTEDKIHFLDYNFPQN